MGIVFGMTGTAEPSYVVLRSAVAASGFEVRRYQSMVIAEIVNSDDSGFSILARYIGVFGTPENDGRVPMAMTAPVILRPLKMAMTSPVIQSGQDQLMSFVLPFDIKNVASAPKPSNKRITLREIPSRLLAVRSFSGWYSHDVGKAQFKVLQKDLLDKKLIRQPSGEEEEEASWSTAQYHPPFTLPFLRRNEIWVELTKEACSSAGWSE